jgi:hypothetical protein
LKSSARFTASAGKLSHVTDGPYEPEEVEDWWSAVDALWGSVVGNDQADLRIAGEAIAVLWSGYGYQDALPTQPSLSLPVLRCVRVGL